MGVTIRASEAFLEYSSTPQMYSCCPDTWSCCHSVMASAWLKLLSRTPALHCPVFRLFSSLGRIKAQLEFQHCLVLPIHFVTLSPPSESVPLSSLLQISFKNLLLLSSLLLTDLHEFGVLIWMQFLCYFDII